MYMSCVVLFCGTMKLNKASFFYLCHSFTCMLELMTFTLFSSMQQRNTSLQFLIRLIYKSIRYATLQNSRKHNTLTHLYRGCGKSAAIIHSIIYRAFELFSLCLLQGGGLRSPYINKAKEQVMPCCCKYVHID